MFSSKLRATTSGFTLIELLVTVTILIILLGGAIAGFMRFRDNQLVFAAAKEAQQLMRLAQSKASARVSPTVTSVCDESYVAADGTRPRVLQGYRVLQNSGTFTVRPLCGLTRASAVLDSTVIKSYSVPSSVTVTGGNVDFYTLEGGTSASPPTYTFTATATGRQHRFQVLITGVITDVIQL